MPFGFTILQPRSVEEAVDVLDRYDGDARAMAGGTALTILLRQRLIAPQAVVSIEQIPGLSAIEEKNGRLHIGALVTHRQVEQSTLIQSRIPVLAATFGEVANVRVRNVATVGGVLAEADYASDPPAVFLALDAEIVVQGPAGPRVIPMHNFMVGFYESAVHQNELITGVTVPIPATGTRAVYVKFRTRSMEDRPCLGVIAAVRLGADKVSCRDLRVAVGAASETPRRLPDVEAMARDKELTGALVARIADHYADAIDTLDDMRGSAWYRKEMIRVWVRRAVEQARDEAVAAKTGTE